jgi:hypothetical protein
MTDNPEPARKAIDWRTITELAEGGPQPPEPDYQFSGSRRFVQPQPQPEEDLI